MNKLIRIVLSLALVASFLLSIPNSHLGKVEAAYPWEVVSESVAWNDEFISYGYGNVGSPSAPGYYFQYAYIKSEAMNTSLYNYRFAMVNYVKTVYLFTTDISNTGGMSVPQDGYVRIERQLKNQPPSISLSTPTSNQTVYEEQEDY